MTATALSDTELLDQARRGDEAAFTELYVRHQAAAYRLANAYRRAGDPDDLVNDAFERVLGALRKGGGPTESFRAYLFVTLRRRAAENISKRRDDPFDEVPEPIESEANAPAMDAADRTIVLQAFESMPERSQAVLWQTAVEGRDPKELAAVLGMSPNAVAALAYRAREKLRQEYLQAHLQAAPKPHCEPHRSRLGAFVRDGLSRRDQTATEAHLDGCTSCTGLVSELLDINKVLSRTMAPVFAASAADIAGIAGGAAAGGASVGGSPAGWAKQGYSKARNNPTGSAVAAGVLAMALVAGLIASQRGGDDPPPDTAAGPPEVEEQAAPPSPEESPEPPPDEPEEPAEAEEPEPAAPPGEVSTARSPDEPTAPAAEEPEPPPPAEDAPVEEPPATPPPAPQPIGAPPPAASPEPPAPTGPVVWNRGAGSVDATITNNSGTGSGLMLLNITLTGGAVIGGAPSGCNIAVALLITTECVVGPIPPGGTVVVRQPVVVTGPNQRATVSQCRLGVVYLTCGGPPLRTTTVVVD